MTMSHHSESLLGLIANQNVKIRFSNDGVIVFSYALRVVESLNFEYGGPLLAIMDEIIRTEDNDVAQQVEPAVKAFSQDWTKEARDRMITRLLDGTPFQKKEPTPDGYLDPDTHTEMLDNHDGLNIFTAEGLLKWQRIAIERSSRKIDQKAARELYSLKSEIRICASVNQDTLVESIGKFRTRNFVRREIHEMEVATRIRLFCWDLGCSHFFAINILEFT